LSWVHAARPCLPLSGPVLLGVAFCSVGTPGDFVGRGRPLAVVLRPQIARLRGLAERADGGNGGWGGRSSASGQLAGPRITNVPPPGPTLRRVHPPGPTRPCGGWPLPARPRLAAGGLFRPDPTLRRARASSRAARRLSSATATPSFTRREAQPTPSVTGAPSATRPAPADGKRQYQSTCKLLLAENPRNRAI
jgi:hypothetical protein